MTRFLPLLLLLACTSAQGGRATAPGDALEGTIYGADLERPHHPVRLVAVSPNLPVGTDIQPVPGYPGTLAVLQKGGVALLLEPDKGVFRKWFELEVQGASEMGLLGLAFAPDFEASGVFYVHHSPPSGDRGVISRFHCDPVTLADVQRINDVLTVQQPYGNHDGGQIRFGPDGHLYVALGDGGSAFDPKGNGQNGQTLLGSILRIIPKPEGGYAVPADNPFIGNPAVDDAIFAMGLRNPWRFDFAPDGRLVVADVGQNAWEEVDIVPAGGNLGWSRQEGRSCLKTPCAGFVEPIWVYGHDEGQSITGGVFSNGAGLPGLAGRFLMGDFVTGRLWALKLPDKTGAVAEQPLALGRFNINPSTFGRDHQGRVYVADFQGVVYRIDGM